MRKIYTHKFDTMLGMVHTAATDKGLVICTLPGSSVGWFRKQLERLFGDCQVTAPNDINRMAAAQITAYLNGELREFSVPLDIRGTPFRQKVLRQVARIPYGETRTYGEVAEAIGRPKAFRAVGGANKHNHLPMIIPCHRVVAARGIGGYAGGLKMKQELLKLEGAIPPDTDR